MKTERFVNSILAIIATIAIGVSGAALADDVEELKGKSVKVTFEDLSLEKESGAHALYRRLQHASKAACGVDASRKSRSAGATSDAYRCYREVLTASVKKVDNELLTQIHEGN
ncbi:MAG: UrcA family protein [Gammaproteobacteria bacterium]|nr:UrcA family protein [Gammaproteobacteria bacterium]